ncbi:MAG: ribosome maturation factor RimM [Acidaminococcaceae bacterium]|nr:ribosome maturation factor RimM [Acidaminococcaceae bacterium]
MDKQVIIGKIVAPHGVRGDIRILPLTEKPEQFLKLNYLLLDNGQQLRIGNVRFHKKMILASAEEITSMNEAELLRGKNVSIFSEDLPPLEEGRFYVSDLLGLKVSLEDGKELGRLKDIISTGNNDVYVIEVPGGKDILLPALKIYVKKIDLNEKLIVVSLPQWVDEA